ncbi:MAG TPA: DUF1232 domain-containing protein [Dehalococcoidia bacterium]|nr:DUF1232 domain-containing protein [Dehalococcoidia bacterium]
MALIKRWRVWLAAARSIRRSVPLWLDPRVPLHLKVIPVIAALYLVAPIDLLPDLALGLGQIDDLGIVLIGLKVFSDLAANALADRREGGARTAPSTIEGSYRVLD